MSKRNSPSDSQARPSIEHPSAPAAGSGGTSLRVRAGLMVLALHLLALTALPAAGPEVIDKYMAAFLKTNQVPGASIAIGRHGKLLYAKGYGWSDKASQSPVQPKSLFRIASISKPVTAVAIMRLVETGRLSLDDKLGEHLKDMPRYRRHPNFDRRIDLITIRQLLRHAGGWDRGKDFDPMGLEGHLRIAKELNLKPPIDVRDYITFMFRRPLQTYPGRYAYSNFGYLLLGRVIEDVTGKPYESFVQDEVLKPLGITTMQIGHIAQEKRAEDEVTYYDHKQRSATAPFGPRCGETVPYPYARPMQVMDSHGGWIASAPDLVRFADHLHKILKPESIRTMFGRQPNSGLDAMGNPTPTYYALGWMVRPQKQSANHWHGGLIQGTSTLLVRRHDGYRWAILFNTSSNPDNKRLTALIDGPFHGLVSSVTDWSGSRSGDF